MKCSLASLVYLRSDMTPCSSITRWNNAMQRHALLKQFGMPYMLSCDPSPGIRG